MNELTLLFVALTFVAIFLVLEAAWLLKDD